MLLRILVIFHFILLLIGCSDNSDKALQSNESQDFRIITLSPHLTELMFLINQEQYLVGVSEYSDFPEAAKSIPRVANHSTIFRESAMAVNPTHAFIWTDGTSHETRDFLAQNNIEIIEFESQSFDDIINDTKRLETFFNLEPRFSKAFENELSMLNNNKVTTNPSVFYVVWTNPLISLGGKQFMSEILQTCGARNVFEDVIQNSFEVSPESVLERQPDLIVKAKDTELPKVLEKFKTVNVSDSGLARPNIGILPAIKTLCEDIASSQRLK